MVFTLQQNKTTMDKNIKQNILRVVEQNGFYNFDGLKYIYVKIRPDDSSTRFNLGDDLAEMIVDDLPEKYREHLVTIRHDGLWDASYVPVFDSDTQAMWDTELSEYIRNKAEWCEKYGCD